MAFGIASGMSGYSVPVPTMGGGVQTRYLHRVLVTWLSLSALKGQGTDDSWPLDCSLVDERSEWKIPWGIFS